MRRKTRTQKVKCLSSKSAGRVQCSHLSSEILSRMRDGANGTRIKQRVAIRKAIMGTTLAQGWLTARRSVEVDTFSDQLYRVNVKEVTVGFIGVVFAE